MKEEDRGRASRKGDSDRDGESEKGRKIGIGESERGREWFTQTLAKLRPSLTSGYIARVNELAPADDQGL